MKQNIGATDKLLRIVLGFIGVYLFFYYEMAGTAAYISIGVGLLLLFTAFAGTCPIYSALGISTNPMAKLNLKEELENGGMIVDVRTPQEYASGHISGSINVPLNTITSKKQELTKKYKTIITCCASGMRSASAKSMLSGTDTKVINGGSWQSLQAKIK